MLIIVNHLNDSITKLAYLFISTPYVFLILKSNRFPLLLHFSLFFLIIQQLPVPLYRPILTNQTQGYLSLAPFLFLHPTPAAQPNVGVGKGYGQGTLTLLHGLMAEKVRHELRHSNVIVLVYIKYKLQTTAPVNENV